MIYLRRNFHIIYQYNKKVQVYIHHKITILFNLYKIKILMFYFIHDIFYNNDKENDFFSYFRALVRESSTKVMYLTTTNIEKFVA